MNTENCIFFSNELDQHFVINLYSLCYTVLLLDQPDQAGSQYHFTVGPNHPPKELSKRDNFD